MAQLQTYSLPDLIAIDKIEGVQCGRPYSYPESVMPGRFVRHKNDPESYGICLSRRWIWDDKPMQCEVLWSREPRSISEIKVQQQTINAPSRRLGAKWSATAAPDINTGNSAQSFFKAAIKPRFEVEEEYESLSRDEFKKFSEEGASIELHPDGKATIKRITSEPPADMSDDGRVRNRNIWTRR